MITNDTMYEEECIAGQLRVLMPVWEIRYVTLCSNGAVQVFKVNYDCFYRLQVLYKSPYHLQKMTKLIYKCGLKSVPDCQQALMTMIS